MNVETLRDKLDQAAGKPSISLLHSLRPRFLEVLKKRLRLLQDMKNSSIISSLRRPRMFWGMDDQGEAIVHRDTNIESHD